MRAFVGVLLLSGWLPFVVAGQSARPSVAGWVGQRIIMLRGYGEVHHAGTTRATTSVGINLVAPVIRVEGDRLWVSATGEDDAGWLPVRDALLLSEAVPHFSAVIAQRPLDWDAYLRRAEAHHALNQREAAAQDYTTAIELHPDEAFLYLRRGRHYRTMNACERALSDFERAIPLVSRSHAQGYNLTAELYSLESGIYSGCPDAGFHDTQRAVETARQAVRLEPSRPTLLTILASAYAAAGDFASAVSAQKRALDSPLFPRGYLSDARRQLDQYQQAAGTTNPK